jgi:hypothetical protein
MVYPEDDNDHSLDVSTYIHTYINTDRHRDIEKHTERSAYMHTH